MTQQRYLQLLASSESELASRTNSYRELNKSSFIRLLNIARRHLRLTKAYKKLFIKNLDCTING